jgi:hypothetical protein
MFADFGAHLSADGLQIYFTSARSGGYGKYDIWCCERDSVDAPWGRAFPVASPVNSPLDIMGGSISESGLELYMSDLKSPPHREGGVGGADIWVARRSSEDEAWLSPENLGNVNTQLHESGPHLAWGDRLLFFSSSRLGGYGASDIWVAVRDDVSSGWSAPVNLGPHVNTRHYENQPALSPDGAWLYFTAERPDGVGEGDLMRIRIRSIRRLIRAIERGTEPL